MKTKTKMAIATFAGLATLAPMSAEAHGGRAFWAGMAGGIVGSAIGNALVAPRVVGVQQQYVTQPMIQQQVIAQPVIQEQVIAQPVIQQEVIAQPVIQEQVIAQPVVQETIITQPVVQETVIVGGGIVPAWGWGRPYPIHGYHHGWGHRPIHHGGFRGFHGGHHVRPGCRHR